MNQARNTAGGIVDDIIYAKGENTRDGLCEDDWCSMRSKENGSKFED